MHSISYDTAEVGGIPVGRWGPREDAKKMYTYSILTRFFVYAGIVLAMDQYLWIPDALAAVALVLLVWVRRNYVAKDLPVWWSRPWLMWYLVLLVGVRFLPEDMRVSVAAVLFSLHQLFSMRAWVMWRYCH